MSRSRGSPQAYVLATPDRPGRARTCTPGTGEPGQHGVGAAAHHGAPELLGNGPTVLALARSDGSAQAHESAGAKVLRGGLADLDVLRSGAAQCDGVISPAFGRDYGSPDALRQAIAEEGAALATLGQEIVGSDRPIVAVSGMPWAPVRASTEADPLPTSFLHACRRGHRLDHPSGGKRLTVSNDHWCGSSGPPSARSAASPYTGQHENSRCWFGADLEGSVTEKPQVVAPIEWVVVPLDGGADEGCGDDALEVVRGRDWWSGRGRRHRYHFLGICGDGCVSPHRRNPQVRGVCGGTP